jgi:hypothetical protein
MGERNIVNSRYLTTAPSEQNAIDIFAGEWASRFPPPHSNLVAGGIPLFEDGRIHWALEQLGGCQGQNVLELGPLEAGHSYLLESNGAASVTAIEANTVAFLKCLISKEILSLKRVRFLCGDFIHYLSQNEAPFDLAVASGVLYHMQEPFRLLQLLASRTNRAYIWTHYYDQQIIDHNPVLRPRFTERVVSNAGGFPCTMYRQSYFSARGNAGFCGGSAEFSYWLTRDDILRALAQYGFHDVRIAHDQPDHPNGPSFSLVAIK